MSKINVCLIKFGVMCLPQGYQNKSHLEKCVWLNRELAQLIYL